MTHFSTIGRRSLIRMLGSSVVQHGPVCCGDLRDKLRRLGAFYDAQFLTVSPSQADVTVLNLLPLVILVTLQYVEKSLLRML